MITSILLWKTQTEGNSTKYMTRSFQKWQGRSWKTNEELYQTGGGLGDMITEYGPWLDAGAEKGHGWKN